jgi:hypothetical protein
MPRNVALVAQQRDALTVYPVAILAELGADVFVTDRFNGVSVGPYESLNLGDHVGDDENDVRENRALVARAAGVDSEHLITVRQVHGATVLDGDAVRAASEADALVSDNSDHALAILVADCVPVAFVDESSGRVALAHAGWRGLDVGVIARTLESFDARATHAFIGPSISKELYQVGPEVAHRFADVEGAVTADGGDRSRLDLRLVATRQLLDVGVKADHIELSRDVTDGGEVFFSDRAHRPCGRFAIVARRAVT